MERQLKLKRESISIVLNTFNSHYQLVVNSFLESIVIQQLKIKKQQKSKQSKTFTSQKKVFGLISLLNQFLMNFRLLEANRALQIFAKKLKCKLNLQYQMNISEIILITILFLTQLAFSLHIGASHDIEHDFCWKDSYERGVGKMPNNCGYKVKIGLNCYEQCPLGYSRFGFDCHQNCPAGFKDDGLFCRLSEYSRGAGYAWKFEDRLSDSGMYSRCEAANGKGNCENLGAIVYPKCKPGFYASGCCICKPSPPKCQALGMNGGIDLSCAKYVKIGNPTPTSCAEGLENNAGLCYPPCKARFYGVGPVCWSNVPKGWIECGMGAAIDRSTCSKMIFDPVVSVAELALNIATFGSSNTATKAGTTTKNLIKDASLAKNLTLLKAAVKNNQQLNKVVNYAKKAKGTGQKGSQSFNKAVLAADAIDDLNNLSADRGTDADIVRITAQVAALADPIGVAAVIRDPKYILCSQVSE